MRVWCMLVVVVLVVVMVVVVGVVWRLRRQPTALGIWKGI